MAGGFLEGFKKIYTGKNIFAKHMYLVLLSLLISLPCSIATLNNEYSGSQSDIYRYIYVEYPLLGILCTIISLAIGIYIIHFMHNSLKYLVWKDNQTDEEKVNALDIMPEINLKMFKHFWKWIGFGIVWGIYIILFVILALLSCFIPGFHIPGIVLLLAIMVSIYFSIPFILMSFAKNYTTKGNFSPLLLFTYLPKIFLPSIVLYLKYIGIIILFCILGFTTFFIIFFIIGIIAGLSGMDFMSIKDLLNNVTTITMMTTIMMYFNLIISLAFYYAVACIYHNKFDINSPEQIDCEK